MSVRWLFLTLGLPLTVAGLKAPPAPTIRGVRLHLFCAATGMITDDVLRRPGLQEWNLTTGEGGAPCVSNAAVLVYVLEGRPSESLSGYRLNIVATEKGAGSGAPREIARQSIRLDVTNGEGLAFVPFLLNETPCHGIKVGAMIGSTPPARVLPLPFRCGP
jgi:hypothetical protein